MQLLKDTDTPFFKKIVSDRSVCQLNFDVFWNRHHLQQVECLCKEQALEMFAWLCSIQTKTILRRSCIVYFNGQGRVS